MNKKLLRITTIVTALLILSTSVISLYDISEASPSDEIDYQSAATELYDFLSTEPTDAEIESYIANHDYGISWEPILITVIFGFTGVIAYSYIHNTDPQVPSGNDTIDYYEQELCATELASSWISLKNIISKVMPSDVSLLNFTSTFWESMVEYSVAGLWNVNSDYVAEYALVDSGTRKNLSSYLYNWQVAIDTSFNQGSKLQTAWYGTAADSMRMVIKWDNGEIKLSNSSSTNYVYADLCSAVITDGPEYVYLDVSENNNDELSNTIYSFNSDNVELDYVGAGQERTYVLSNGKNDISSFPAGIYRINDAASLAGPFLPSAESYSKDRIDAEIRGAFVFSNGTDYKLATMNGDSVSIDGLDSSSLKYVVRYTNVDKRAASYESDVSYILSNYDAMIKQVADLIDKSSICGQITWNIYDECEESSIYVKPSSVMSSLAKNQNLSYAEIQIQTMAAMKSIAEYYNTNKGALESIEIVAEPSAFNLIVYGDIYYNGTLFLENVAYTPYTTVNAQTIIKGDQSNWNQPGFLTVWKKDILTEEDFKSWIESDADIASYSYTSLEDGFVFDTKSIYYNEKYVDSVTIDVYEIARSDNSGENLPTPTPSPDTISASILVMIILIELGMIIALLGYNFGSVKIMAIGGIVILLSFLISGFVANILTDWFGN